MRARAASFPLSIPAPDEAARRAARDRWNAVAKPIGSLGELELAVEKMAALVGSADVKVDKRAVVVLCADNGVVAQGVSQSGHDVTTAVARNIARGTSSVCRMAQTARADVYAVDMGMAQPPYEKNVIDRSMGRGTADITAGPAMSRERAELAIEAGRGLVEHFSSQGYQIIATGEMGIGNTTTSSAMAAAFLGLPVRVVTGRGAGLSDAGLARKRAAIEQALEVNAVDPGDALGVLAALGGFDIAGMVGMFVGAAERRIPIVVDGFISALCAYTAEKLAPGCSCAMLASHVSAEPAARLLLEALGLSAPIQAGLRLGEGTGAVCLLPLLDAALALYNGTTFQATGIEAYSVHPR